MFKDRIFPKWILAGCPLQASLSDLNDKCPEEITMDRFRPNVVVSGAKAWDEDSWESLKIGSLDFTATMPTGRCTVQLL